MATLDDLLNDIFDGNKSALYPEFERWIKESRRFKAFAITYRSKIRAKVKGVRDEGGMKDLRSELETALLLLRESRFTLEYEKYAALKQRGPDFTVTFKTHTPFNIEVRRIRNLELDDGDSEVRTGKLMGVLCEKIRQMPPGIINLLWLNAEGEISETDLTHAMLTLRQMADRKVEDYFTRRGFKNAADFLKHYQQLSGILLRKPDASLLWLNPLARHKVLPEIAKALERLETN